jgi:hypothetical protein
VRAIRPSTATHAMIDGMCFKRRGSSARGMELRTRLCYPRGTPAKVRVFSTRLQETLFAPEDDFPRRTQCAETRSVAMIRSSYRAHLTRTQTRYPRRFRNDGPRRLVVIP